MTITESCCGEPLLSDLLCSSGESQQSTLGCGNPCALYIDLFRLGHASPPANPACIQRRSSLLCCKAEMLQLGEQQHEGQYDNSNLFQLSQVGRPHALSFSRVMVNCKGWT